MASTRDMTEGRPAKLLTAFALPLMLGNVFQQLYTMVDAAVVGNYIGIEALAAVGAADWLNWLVLGAMMGFTQGFTIPTAQRFGAGDREGLKKSITNSLILTALIAVVFTVVSLAAMKPVLRLMDTPAESFDGAVDYLFVMFAGIAVVGGYNIFASILRALGDSRNPLIAMIIASILNVLLDLLFVVVFEWGITGAAVATVIGQLFSCIYCAICVFRIPTLDIKREDWRLDRATARETLRLGSPMAFMNAIIGVGGLVVQSVVNGFGYVFVAGFTATNKLYGLLELAATSFGYSMATYAGQNLGAGKYDRIRKGATTAAIIGASIAVVIGVAMFIFGEQLIGLFVSDPDPAVVAEGIRVGFTYLKYMAVCLPILYLLHIYRSANQGMGDTFRPMLSGIAELVMRIAAAMLLPIWLAETGIYYAEVVAWTGAVAILIPSYFFNIRKYPRDGAI